MLRIALIVVLALFSLPVVAVPASAAPGSHSTWARTLTATATEGFLTSSVEQTTDSGFIVSGTTINSRFVAQVWLLRLDATGAIVWQKAYGNFSLRTPSIFLGPKVKQTPDGGFIVSTATNVSSTNIAWVFKVDPSGDLKWQEGFTGTGNALFFSLDNTADGGVLLAGTNSRVRGYLVDGTALVVKLNSNGVVQWEKMYSGQGSPSHIR